MKKILDLSYLTSWELARLMMTKLWQQYSASGINNGRSLRAALLEVIVFTSECVETENEFDVNRMMDEAVHRKGVGNPNQLPLVGLGITGLPRIIFYCFALRELHKWYKINAFDQFGSILFEECNIVRSLLRLLRVEEHLSYFDEKKVSFSPEEIICEGKNRIDSVIFAEVNSLFNI